MAFQLRGPLTVKGYKDGKPVFDLPSEAALPAPAAPAPASVPAPQVTSTGRPNKFAGECMKCHATVPEQAGLLVKQDGRWLVSHKDGACVAAPAPAPVVPSRGPVCTPDGKEPSKGYFTAEFVDESGEQTYVTLRLRRQSDKDRFKPGQLLVGFLSGSDNMAAYTNFGNVDAKGRCWIWPRYSENTRLGRAVAAVLRDVRAAGEAWARESQHCWRCGQPLTTPESLDALVGPDCKGMLGL